MKPCSGSIIITIITPSCWRSSPSTLYWIVSSWDVTGRTCADRGGVVPSVLGSVDREDVRLHQPRCHNASTYGLQGYMDDTLTSRFYASPWSCMCVGILLKLLHSPIASSPRISHHHPRRKRHNPWVWALPLATAKLGGGAPVSYHHHTSIFTIFHSSILLVISWSSRIKFRMILLWVFVFILIYVIESVSYI